MTFDRSANARVVGQLEAQLAELEGTLRRKEGGRTLNFLLTLFGVGLLVVAGLGVGLASSIWYCWGILALVSVIVALVGATGLGDGAKSAGHLQAEIVKTRTRLAELRALMMG